MQRTAEVATDEPERLEGGVLEQLYVRHADRAIRVAYLLTGDRALAEDLVQEAFLKLAGRFLHVRNAAAFESYLRRTVVNLANSHHRRLRSERTKLARHA
ncbi:MAG TPA: sigma factor, partial [Actinomycetota bacterium]|nr:sigma factor [Actinomycetota bacterium]